MSLTSILLASAAFLTFSTASHAESYFYRSKPLVDPPLAFVFSPVLGANPGAIVESSPTRLSGYSGSTVAVSSGGQYQICSVPDCSDQSSWKTEPSAILSGTRYARVRATAATYDQTTSVRLNAGDVSSDFAVTSRAKDTVPAPFSFGNATNVEPNAVSYSNPVILADFDGAPLSVSGGGYQICSSSTCAEMNGQPVLVAPLAEVLPGARIRLAAGPMSFRDTAVVTLNVGGITSSFSATARAKDETPAAITFVARTNQVAGQEIHSEIRQLVDHEGVTVSASGVGSSYRICSDATCSTNPPFSGSVLSANRDSWVQLRQVAPTAGETRVATLSYGTLSTQFSVSSAAAGGDGKTTFTISQMGISDASTASLLTRELGGSNVWTLCGTDANGGNHRADFARCVGADHLLVVATANNATFGGYVNKRIVANEAFFSPARGFLFASARGHAGQMLNGSGTAVQQVGTIEFESGGRFFVPLYLNGGSIAAFSNNGDWKKGYTLSGTNGYTTYTNAQSQVRLYRR